MMRPSSRQDRARGETRPASLRQGGLNGGWTVTVAAWTLALVLVYIGVKDGVHVGALLRTLSLCALISWLGWWLGAFPRLDVTPQAVTVVNLLRRVRIPKVLITDIHDIGMVTFTTTHRGELLTVRSWGAPGAPRPRLMSGSAARRGPLSEANPEVFQAVQGGVIRTAIGWSPTESDVPLSSRGGAIDTEIRWNRKELLLLGFLLVLNVAIWLR